MKRQSIVAEKIKEADIMITPLADVSFTILMTLMVLTPILILSSRLYVKLPEAITVEPPTEKNIAITITSDFELSVNDELLDRDEMAGVLSKMIKENPDYLILIRADRNVETGMVMNIIALVKKLGARNISIATVQRPK
jgi:biopolymer transport protein ExbD